MDSTAFTAQLAQFTSLEQLYNLNSSFEGLKNAMTSQNNYQAANLIGRNVTATGRRSWRKSIAGHSSPSCGGWRATIRVR